MWNKRKRGKKSRIKERDRDENPVSFYCYDYYNKRQRLGKSEVGSKDLLRKLHLINFLFNSKKISILSFSFPVG